MNTDRAKSLAEYLDFVETYAQDSAESTVWFRGHSDAAYDLRPSLYRHPTASTLSELMEVEGRLLNHFKERAVFFTKNEIPAEDWNQLFVMQHFGVPTRLLDWSENALIALWFALKRFFGGGKFTGDACVWILDPYALNRNVFDLNPAVSIFSISDSMLESYRPGQPVKQQRPVALYGMHNNPRIVAQRGAFTIAGSDLDAFLDSSWMPVGVLHKIVIGPEESLKIANDLKHMGFTESMIYPDLEGLARELRNQEGF